MEALELATVAQLVEEIRKRSLASVVMMVTEVPGDTDSRRTYIEQFGDGNTCLGLVTRAKAVMLADLVDLIDREEIEDDGDD